MRGTTNVARCHTARGLICAQMITLLIVVTFASCTDDRDPVGPDDDGPAESHVTSPLQDRTGPYTIRDVWADMARRLPGKFGGLFVDSGVVRVVSADPEHGAELLSALQDEAFIVARRSSPRGGAFDMGNARLWSATYSDAQYFW